MVAEISWSMRALMFSFCGANRLIWTPLNYPTNSDASCNGLFDARSHCGDTTAAERPFSATTPNYTVRGMSWLVALLLEMRAALHLLCAGFLSIAG